ncbi:periplasmic protein involved in polysaccharide export [Prevotella dentalis DSM 3688]|uniref:Capsule polysaccharide export protein n=1 Tax=Prevotella dentalis (strain ATCC 49559 / DSM 3688 / JCM 13448 / NCTC 12043 / ES 2772) TaxID=908937 RepID=F9D0N7_PREDD|nr:SLBB domain-containing protein [Prevotella dentalis]AGB27742.1 periplasmic protein involved in polysaccharide export [Prevotella dentalis DSM 3688]EGQ16566.1 capsule polysaccharide export protein [Prevotella dentalis DSM 3688]
MKKLIIALSLLLLAPMAVQAQSSMTDTQVAQFVQQEVERGTPQSQIVTKLMQRGVDITQIRRVRRKYQQMSQDGGLGRADQSKATDNRLRTNNGKDKEADKARTQREGQQRETTTSQRIQGTSKWKEKYDENDADFVQMQDELALMTPEDSLALLRRMLNWQKKEQRKVFGRDIFNNKELTFEPEMNIATPQNYRLGPGDAVVIDVYGASQKSLTTTVSPDGDIVVENFGPIAVSGLTVAQANARIRGRLGARYQSSQIKISLGQTRTISINVMGEVKNPGTYTLSAFATVFHALYMAGGTNELGTLRNIKIYRRNRLVSVCDIYDYILNGKMTGNVRLADSDVIIVGPYDCLVNLTGKVKRPMFYEMRKSESVESLLRYAGGFTGDAYTKAVRVNRKTGREYAVFNVEEFDMSSFRMADGDSVSVDSILPRYQNTVEVKGAVFRPGMYQMGNSINSVRTLIQHAEGLTEEAFTNRAVMHRMKADRTLEVVSVDVEGIMSGRVADLPLRENDVLFIPSRQEAMTERTITIHGEVHYPGIYKYADNETLEDFVLQAGGLKETASTVKVDVSRRVGNPRALSTDSIIARSYSFALKDGFVVDGQPGFTLMPFDEVYVRKSPAYSEQKNVSIEGEVVFAGDYTLTRRNARLTDLLKAAGGITDQAYVKGARLERVPTESERVRMEAAFKMQQEQLQQQLMALAASSNSGNIQQVAQQANSQLDKYQVPNTYPVGIELDKALADPTSDANIVLREGDKLILPQYTATVKINGAVMYPNTIAYQKGKGAKYYINAAGGFSQNARKSNAYVIYMNGMVGKLSQGAHILPGCEIVVPSKISRRMSIAETMSLGSGMASIAAMIATIANLAK